MTQETYYTAREGLINAMAAHEADVRTYPETVYIDMTAGEVRADYDGRAGVRERVLCTLAACDRRLAWDWFTADGLVPVLDELGLTEQQAADITGDYDDYGDHERWSREVLWDLFDTFAGAAREAFAEACYSTPALEDYGDAADTILEDLERELAWEGAPA